MRGHRAVFAMGSSFGVIFRLNLVGVVVFLFGVGLCGATVNKHLSKSAMEAMLRPASFDGDMSKAVYFSDSPQWADLLAILNKRGQSDVEVICIHGAWILYRNTHYVTRSAWDYAILSGSQLCMRWRNTRSMQPLGLLDDAFTPSVTFFTEPHMGSIGSSVNSRRGRKYFEYLGGSVKSLIVFGMSQWTVTDVKGKEYCLATNFDRAEALPICKLDDLTLSPVGAPWDIESITRGCSGDITKDRLVHLRDCDYFGRPAGNGPSPAEIAGVPGDGPDVPDYDSGFGEPGGHPGVGEPGEHGWHMWHWNWKQGGGIDDNDPEGYNLVGEPYNYLNTPPTKKPKISTTTDRNGGGGGGGGGGTDEPDLGDRNRTDTTPDPFVNMKCPNKEIEQYALLLATRFNHDFEGEEQILWPARKGDIWKAELVDAVFHIAMNLLTQSFVPRGFLLLVREIAMYEFSNHWKRVKSHLPNFKQRLVMLDLARCDEMIGSSPPIINQLNNDMWLDKEPKEVFEILGYPEDTDIVIDITYLLMNLVMGACHHIFDYTTNFWVNFGQIFMKDILNPMVDSWLHFTREDISILGGYDFGSQHLRLQVITTTMLQMTPSLEPFDRPKELYDQLKEGDEVIYLDLQKR